MALQISKDLNDGSAATYLLNSSGVYSWTTTALASNYSTAYAAAGDCLWAIDNFSESVGNTRITIKDLSTGAVKVPHWRV